MKTQDKLYQQMNKYKKDWEQFCINGKKRFTKKELFAINILNPNIDNSSFLVECQYSIHKNINILQISNNRKYFLKTEYGKNVSKQYNIPIKSTRKEPTCFKDIISSMIGFRQKEITCKADARLPIADYSYLPIELTIGDALLIERAQPMEYDEKVLSYIYPSGLAGECSHKIIAIKLKEA